MASETQDTQPVRDIDQAEPIEHPPERARAIHGGKTEGVPLKMAGGETWLLAHARTIRDLDSWRDRLFDNAALHERVDIGDAINVAFCLLRKNYRLGITEATDLLLGTDRREMLDAVWLALFGQEEPRRTYSAWVRASLALNGIDPETVHPEDLNHVLGMLVQMKRTVPLSEFSDSVEAATQLSEWRALAKASQAQQPKPEPTAPAEARQVDFQGELISDLPIDRDAVLLDLTPHELARDEVTFGPPPGPA